MDRHWRIVIMIVKVTAPNSAMVAKISICPKPEHTAEPTTSRVNWGWSHANLSEEDSVPSANSGVIVNSTAQAHTPRII